MPARAIILASSLVAADSADLIRAVAQQVPVALASDAPRVEVEGELARAGLGDAFEAVICSDDVESGRPDPAPILNALAGINEKRPMSDAILAPDVVAVEDSDAGMAASRAAGVRAIRAERLDLALVEQLLS